MTADALTTILSVPEFRLRFERLRKLIEKDPHKVVPWIGAGMSKAFGLPLWQEFLERASQELVPKEKEVFDQLIALPNPDLSLAAELLQGRLGGLLRQTVIDTFNKSTRWDPGNSLIPWLGLQKVVTTNYDRVLDSGLPWLAPVSGSTAAGEYRDRRCLIKLHGRVDDPKTIVLTVSQYVRAYTSEFWTWLEQFARDHTLLFLGCSLHGDEFLKVLKTSTSGAAPQHFAIIPTSSPEESLRRGNQLLQDYGIQTISYDPVQHGHSVVRELIQELRPSLAAETKQIEGITNEAELTLAWFRFNDDGNRAARDDRISYLTTLLPVAGSLCPGSEIQASIFDELLKYGGDQTAFDALRKAAEGSPDALTRVLRQRKSLRPVYEITKVLPQSSDPQIIEYYRAFRAGEHEIARQYLLKIEKRPTVDRGRIAVLLLQNELYAGRRDQQLVVDLEHRLAKDARRFHYLPYGLGLFNVWTGELKRAKSNFQAARNTWRMGSGAFVFWQFALCAILEGDFNVARVQLAEMEDAAFLPLGPAGRFLEKAGGSELSLEPRRTASQELHAWIWFLQDLVARASGQSDDLEKRSGRNRALLERSAEEDLLLSWFLYATRLLEGENDEPLRIELQFRTRSCAGTRIVLDAVGLLLKTVSNKAAASFAAATSVVA